MIAIAVLNRVYRWSIRLYPQAFRVNFADEMLDVFEQSLQAAARQGVLPALGVCLGELIDLPVNLLLEHLHQKGKAMKQPRNKIQDIQTARKIARVSSLLLTLFFGFVILRTEQSAIFTVTILAMSVGLFVAWRQERPGGLLTIGCALTCAVLVGLNAMVTVPNLGILKSLLWGLGCMVVVLTCWASPYLLLGWLFLSIGRHSDKVMQPPLQNRSPAAS